MNNNQNNNANVSSNVDAVNDLNNKETSNNFAKSLVLIEIIVFILCIILFTYYNSKNNNFNSNIDFNFNKFNEVLSNNNFLVKSDNTFVEWDTQGYIKSYYTADKENIYFEYLECVDNNAGYNMFDAIKKGINDNRSNYSKNVEEISYSDYSKYAITTNGYRYITVKYQNIIVYAKTTENNSEELNNIFNDWGLNIELNNRPIIFVKIFALFMSIIMIASFWNIFVKSGLKGWYSLIPFYNLYNMFKISLGNGWYLLLMLVPIANFVIIFMLWYKLAKVFGKSSGFAVFNAFIPIIGVQIIAFDGSEYLMNN